MTKIPLLRSPRERRCENIENQLKQVQCKLNNYKYKFFMLPKQDTSSEYAALLRQVIMLLTNKEAKLIAERRIYLA